MRSARILICAMAASFMVACSKDSADTEPLVAYCTAVYEYMPAPGQFIGEGFSAATVDEACSYALERLHDEKFVSLGGFGGYIIVGFDHTIAKAAGLEIGIKGNATESSSEPGIVWVMRDSNGNCKPDDTWYELKGSRYDDPGTKHSYSVTYYRPAAEDADVSWSDEEGNEGVIEHLTYHKQCYYPEWQAADSYTLVGTCLKALNTDQSGDGTYWVNPSYGSGYADNYDPDGMEGAFNLFSIDDAVDVDGSPACLDGVDFVKVQTGVNTSSGWLGEASTEVCSIVDWQMYKAQ